MKFWRRLKSDKLAIISLAVIMLVVFVAIFGPLLAPYDPYEKHLAPLPLAPSKEHLLGTDEHGVDILSKILYGARLSLGIGLGAAAIAVIVGLIVGVLAGYFGGWVDGLLSRIIDLVMAFPSLLLIILIAAVIERGLLAVFLALGLVSWAGIARIMRGLVLGLKEREFAESALASGSGHLRIIFRHIIPNCLSTLLVIFTMRLGGMILAEASLNFLGLGAGRDSPSWGAMVRFGKDWLVTAPWVSLGPASAIAITVLAFNLFGDGLRDALAPRMRVS